MQHSSSSEANNFLASLEIPPHFMNPESLLPRLQDLTTSPYPESHQSKPSQPIFEDSF